MKSLRQTALKAAVALCVLVVGTCLSIHADDPAKPEAPAKPAKDRVLDLRGASIPLSVAGGGSEGARGKSFTVGHTLKKGWSAKVASTNPRSPAAAEGIVVAGSGRGNVVWGYNGESGKRNWKDTSRDSGISNIVIGLGRAYYTTYSCTLEGVDIHTGKHLFTKWLAPTVSCAPDVDDKFAACAYNKGGGWNLSLHNASSGSIKWSKNADGAVITAPVIFEEGVYVSTIEGKVQRFEQAKGKQDWTADLGAVSAPVPTNWGLLVTTTWSAEEDAEPTPPESMTAEERRKWERETTTSSSTLRGTVAASKDRRVMLVKDPTVKPEGKSKVTVSGPQSSLDYQGVRPGVSNRNVIFAYGGKITAVSPSTGRVVWSTRVSNMGTRFVRPVCHEGLVFVACDDGVVTALEEETGALVWSYHFTGQSFVSEPAADADRLFLTTHKGLLISMPIGIDGIDFGRAQANEDGMEGAAAAYRKVQETFRRVRNAVRGIKEPEEPETPAPDARGGDRREGAPGSGEADDDAVRREDDEVEELTKGQWERREERRAQRAKAEGKKYEKKPFKRR